MIVLIFIYQRKYFHLPENKIRALLNGYFIGDGHTDENSKWGKN